MKKQTLSLLLALAAGQYIYAQAPAQATAIVTEKWADKPALHTIEAKYAKEPAVILADTRRVQYVDEPKNEMAEYYTLHKLVHINDDRGIEQFNKIYLGVGENADLTDVKARTVLPGGKVVELNKNNIKDIKEKDGNTYKIFAMEGLEKGCEVEFTYTFKKDVAFMGREVVQTEIPSLNTTFEVIAPERLRFEMKAYNFNGEATDTVLNSKRISTFVVKDSPGAEDEKYADYSANLRRIEFKLAYNDQVRKGERLFTWNELARRVYSAYTDYTDKENAALADMVKENGWDKLPDETSKIIAVEDYIKKKFGYNEDMDDEEPNKLQTILKNKISGTRGMMRLYTAIFQNLGINYQYVLAADKTKLLIDRRFENWNNCDYSLFYFPAENKFIAPTRPDFRYPWVMPSWAGANGLFFRRTTLGTVSTAMGDVRPVNQEDYSKTHSNIQSHLELTNNLDSLNIDDKMIFSGYAAVQYRDLFNLANDDDKRKFIKEMAKNLASSENVLFSEILNPEFEKATDNVPLTLHFKTRSGELLEKAGNKLLVKIGMAIGQQVEMYQEKPRQSPVNIEYGQVEERNLELMIPAGYKVSNLNDLKISQTYNDNGEQTMGFVSDYKLTGNMLSIHIVEDYRKTFYPLSQFEQFKKIINASADFNKVVLVLEKI